MLRKMAPNLDFHNPKDALLLLAAAWAVSFVLIKVFRRDSGATPLRGPPSPSRFFGYSRVLTESQDSAAVYGEWAAQYGPVFRIPAILGSYKILLCDPKALAHFYSKETFTYVQTGFSRIFIEKFFGRGLLWAEGESHRRQRKALTPAFSNAAIKRLTSVFYDSTYKCKAAWDNLIENNAEGSIIEVQSWMNHISLDSVGIAGFSHEFASLDGKESAVSTAFEAIGTRPTSFLSAFIFLLSPVFPVLARLPTSRNQVFKNLHRSLTEISDTLLARTRQETQGKLDGYEEKSIIGLLIKAENAKAELHLTQEEVIAQMNVLLLAGYETTSISLTWTLIELSRHLEVQKKLRQELLDQFPSGDPTWEQLTSGLPYLDAVVHEVLRLHPPLKETVRKVAFDDIIPLSKPIVDANGNTVSSISVKKGQVVSSPIALMNRAEWIWGSDASTFRPDRWLEPGFGEKNDIQGHRHLLTFVDGPRTCLGKGFALAEFKAALSVLVRNFTFEFSGPEPKIERHQSILPRPKFEGQDGAKIPLRVHRVE
ncbi:hypothetical protein HGRIS_009067 [Hohenbuehelia grisea]|uniref:Cytochrome P450 n=1 Tax=Hohenbuehelia grisea TaxID=104357 RepID=A0ABR3J015_9AGAR